MQIIAAYVLFMLVITATSLAVLVFAGICFGIGEAIVWMCGKVHQLWSRSAVREAEKVRPRWKETEGLPI